MSQKLKIRLAWYYYSSLFCDIIQICMLYNLAICGPSVAMRVRVRTQKKCCMLIHWLIYSHALSESGSKRLRFGLYATFFIILLQKVCTRTFNLLITYPILMYFGISLKCTMFLALWPLYIHSNHQYGRSRSFTLWRHVFQKIKSPFFGKKGWSHMSKESCIIFPTLTILSTINTG